jgi:transcriptional regulator with XRE-family HTH domain
MKVSKRQTEIRKRVQKKYPSKLELAVKIGMHPSYYSKFLNDKTDLSEDMLSKIEKTIL